MQRHPLDCLQRRVRMVQPVDLDKMQVGHETEFERSVCGFGPFVRPHGAAQDSRGGREGGRQMFLQGGGDMG